jgi:uncharacterized protein
MRPRRCTDTIERVVRLIRSKGVGVYFITQNPIDIPERWPASSATGCSTRCAPSPQGQAAIKAAADTFRINPDLNVETAITELKVGEALVPVAGPAAGARTARLAHEGAIGPADTRRAAVFSSIPWGAG